MSYFCGCSLQVSCLACGVSKVPTEDTYLLPFPFTGSDRAAGKGSQSWSFVPHPWIFRLLARISVCIFPPQSWTCSLSEFFLSGSGSPQVISSFLLILVVSNIFKSSIFCYFCHFHILLALSDFITLFSRVLPEQLLVFQPSSIISR